MNKSGGVDGEADRSAGNTEGKVSHDGVQPAMFPATCASDDESITFNEFGSCGEECFRSEGPFETPVTVACSSAPAGRAFFVDLLPAVVSALRLLMLIEFRSATGTATPEDVEREGDKSP